MWEKLEHVLLVVIALVIVMKVYRYFNRPSENKHADGSDYIPYQYSY